MPHSSPKDKYCRTYVICHRTPNLSVSLKNVQVVHQAKVASVESNVCSLNKCLITKLVCFFSFLLLLYLGFFPTLSPSFNIS